MGTAPGHRCPLSESLRFLLDEHYPGWLADQLTARGVDAVALTAHRPVLRGADDREVLTAAVREERVVVTEDVTTFRAAILLLPDHLGVVFCHHERFPRSRPGLHRLGAALVALTDDPPPGLGRHPVEWWLRPVVSAVDVPIAEQQGAPALS